MAGGAGTGSLLFNTSRSQAAKSNESRRKNKYRTSNYDPSKFIVVGKKKDARIEVSYAKLLSIAKGLQQNILPKAHTHLNEIYEIRLKKYLSLKSIHGDDNQAIADKLFDAERDSVLHNLQKEVKQRQMRDLSNEFLRKDKQMILDNQPYYRTNQGLLDSARSKDSMKSGSIPLTELRFDGDFSNNKVQIEEDFLVKYNFLGKNRTQEQFHQFLYEQALKIKQQQQKTNQQELFNKSNGRNVSKGHGSPQDGDHDKMMRTYDDLVVDHLIASANPVVSMADQPENKTDKEGVYKIFCSSLAYNNDQNQFWNSAINDTQNNDKDMSQHRAEEDLSPATLSKHDATTNRTPKIHSQMNVNKIRSSTSKSVLSSSFLQQNIPAKQIVIFDAHQKDMLWKINKDYSEEKRIPQRASEQRLSKPMTSMEETKKGEQTSPSLKGKNERRIPLDQKAVVSINRGSDSQTVNSFQKESSNSVMLKAQWHMGPGGLQTNLKMRNKRGSGGVDGMSTKEPLVPLNNQRQKSAEPGKQKLEWKDSANVFSTKTRSSGKKVSQNMAKFRNQTLSQPVQPILTIKNRTSNQLIIQEDIQNEEITQNIAETAVTQRQKSALKTSEFTMPIGQKSQKALIRQPFQLSNVKKIVSMQLTKLNSNRSSPQFKSPKHSVNYKIETSAQNTPENFYLPAANQLQRKFSPTEFSPPESATALMQTSKSAVEEIQTEYQNETMGRGFQPVRLSRFYKETSVRLSHPIISIAQVLEQAAGQTSTLDQRQKMKLLSAVTTDGTQLDPGMSEDFSQEAEKTKKVPHFQIQVELGKEDQTVAMEPLKFQTQASVLCLVKKRSSNLSPRYNQKQNKVTRFQPKFKQSSEDLKEVYSQPSQRKKELSTLQETFFEKMQQNQSGIETERVQKNYIQTVGEYLNHKHNSEHAVGEDHGAQTRFDGPSDKISLLSSIGSLDPQAQKMILMAVLKAKIKHLSAVQNPFKVAQEQLKGKNINMYATATQKIKNLQLDTQELNATRKLKPITAKASTQKINAQFSQPIFKRSQAMIAAPALSAAQNLYKKAKIQTAESKEKLYALLEKCLNEKKIEPEKNDKVLELLLALERHDEWAFRNKGQLTEQQNSETRNRILQALLNIFMRLQEQEDQTKKYFEVPNNRVVLSSQCSPKSSFGKVNSTKNIATAVNLSTFERDSNLIKEENMSKNTTDQLKQTTFKNLTSTQQFPSASHLCNSPVKLKPRNYANQTKFHNHDEDSEMKKDYEIAVNRQNFLLRPQTTKARAGGLPQNADLPPNMFESSKSLSRFRLPKNDSFIHNKTQKPTQDDSNPPKTPLIMPMAPRDSVGMLSTTPLGGANRRVLVHRSGNISTSSGPERLTKCDPNRYENGPSGEKNRLITRTSRELKVSEEASSDSSFSVRNNISEAASKKIQASQSHVLIFNKRSKNITPDGQAETLQQSKFLQRSRDDGKQTGNQTPLSQEAPDRSPMNLEINEEHITLGNGTSTKIQSKEEAMESSYKEEISLQTSSQVQFKNPFQLNERGQDLMQPISNSNLYIARGLKHNKSHVDSNTFMRLRQQRLQNSLKGKTSRKIQPQQDSVEPIRGMVQSFKARTFGFRNPQQASKRPATTGQNGLRRSMVVKKDSKLFDSFSKRQSGGGNFSIINQPQLQDANKNGQLTERNLHANPSLVILASGNKHLHQQIIRQSERKSKHLACASLGKDQVMLRSCSSRIKARQQQCTRRV